jgi:hypothetical protein
VLLNPILGHARMHNVDVLSAPTALERAISSCLDSSAKELAFSMLVSTSLPRWPAPKRASGMVRM